MPEEAPYIIEGRARTGQAVVICDHATNTVPAVIPDATLGIPLSDMNRHIAYDIGALGVSRRLAQRLDAPLIFSNFSRLVIDPNRGEDDPTLIMQLYDGSVIPANRTLCAEDRALRVQTCYHPYHNAIRAVLAERENPVIISIHSFTPQLKNKEKRPWHIGILYADDTRLADLMLDLLTAEQDICVGDNAPYTGKLKGDTMDQHALQYERHHVLIEIRNDLIETPQNQHKWADRLAPIVNSAIKTVLENEG